MKVYSIMIVRVTSGAPVICTSAIDVSNLGILQRRTATEFLVFLSKAVATRVERLSRTQVSEQGHVISAHSFADGALVAVAITDKEYPTRVTFNMLSSVECEFESQFRGRWEDGCEKDNQLEWPQLATTLAKFQKPETVDGLLMVKKDLDETKVIMHNAIEQILERGEKMDDLVQASSDLGAAAKSFHGSTRRSSWCCPVM